MRLIARPLLFAVLPALLFTGSMPQLPAQAAKPAHSAAAPTVDDALDFLGDAELDLSKLSIATARATWVQETFITDDTVALSAEAQDREAARRTQLIAESKRFQGLKLPAEAARKMKLLQLSGGFAPADPALRAEATRTAAELDAAYGRGKYCPDDNADHCMGIDDLDVRMATDRKSTRLNSSHERRSRMPSSA